MGKPGRDRAPSPVNPGESATRQEVRHEGLDQVAPQGRKASGTGKIKPQSSILLRKITTKKKLNFFCWYPCAGKWL